MHQVQTNPSIYLSNKNTNKINKIEEQRSLWVIDVSPGTAKLYYEQLIHLTDSGNTLQHCLNWWTSLHVPWYILPNPIKF
jgi:hypothetical protein